MNPIWLIPWIISKIIKGSFVSFNIISNLLANHVRDMVVFVNVLSSGVAL